MLEAVVECLVKRKLTAKSFAARVGMISLDCFIAMATFLFAGLSAIVLSLGFVLFVAGIFFTYIVFRNTDVEYEYQFFDGDFRIDKVMHKMTRKKLKVFSFSKLEMMAPEGSHRLGGGVNDRKRYDFSSQMEEDKHYIAILYDENGAVELKITPNEELLERLARTYPRKVYND